MKLSFIDTGSYLRGMLILIRKDNVIHKNETELMDKILIKMGFDPEIFKDTLSKFLYGKLVDEVPPKFSSKRATIKFILDAIEMSFVDNYFHIKELGWLDEVAKRNGVPPKFCKKKINRYLEKYPEKKEALNPKNWNY